MLLFCLIFILKRGTVDVLKCEITMISENICIDVGMTKQMIYHRDNGWSLENNYHYMKGEYYVSGIFLIS